MKLSGFKCLKQIESNSRIKFSDIENIYDTKLPYQFKVFVSNFILGADSLNKAYYQDKEIEMMLPLTSLVFGKDQYYVELDTFLTMEESVEDRPIDDNLLGVSSLNLIKIANTSIPTGGGIYMGLNDENFGCIYRVDWDGIGENAAIKIANDIFEFIFGIESKLILSNNLDHSQLYKNWGEDFWRVRE